MKKKIICTTLAVLMLLSLISCGGRIEKVYDRPSIVTTNFALFDFARAVVGDKADVTMLLAPGNESHDFEVTLSDLAKIENADLFVCNGGESEIDWVNSAMISIYDPPETVATLMWCEAYEEETVEGMAEDDGEEEEDGAVDEHCWTSIENAVLIVDRLCERLSDKYPEYADEFRRNAEAYTSELNGLIEEYRAVIDSAKRRTIVVADRFPFRYLAEEFSLDYYAAFSGCTSATEPQLSTVNFLIEKVKTEEIPAIFVIEFSDGRTAGAVADECGCEILTLHSAHNVSKEDYRAGVTYADLMRLNLDALKTALN